MSFQKLKIATKHPTKNVFLLFSRLSCSITLINKRCGGKTYTLKTWSRVPTLQPFSLSYSFFKMKHFVSHSICKFWMNASKVVLSLHFHLLSPSLPCSCTTHQWWKKENWIHTYLWLLRRMSCMINLQR